MNDNVNERLARLERENRRMKMVGLLMLALFAGLFLLGQASKPSAQGTVTAKEFRLVDGRGNSRAMLSTSTDGEPGLFLYDEDGRKMATFVTDSLGTPALSLYDLGGKKRATFDTLGDGSPGLWFYDENSKVRAMFSTLPGHGFGGEVFGLGLDTIVEGSPCLCFWDQDGNLRAVYSLDEHGKSFLNFVDKDGKPIWNAP